MFRIVAHTPYGTFYGIWLKGDPQAMRAYIETAMESVNDPHFSFTTADGPMVIAPEAFKNSVILVEDDGSIAG